MKIHCLYDECLPLHKIIPNPRNTNEHPERQIELLAKVIDYLGIRHPIIVSKRSGFIVAGHGRLEAAEKLGLENYPVVYQEFENEAEEYEFLEADNRLAELSEHNVKKMHENIKQIEGIKIEMLGIPDIKMPEVELKDQGNDEFEDFDVKKKDPPKLCPHCGEEL